MQLPETGLDRDEVMKRLHTLGEDDLDTRGGKTWAYVFDSGRSDIDQVAEEAFVAFMHENALDPTVFPSLMRMEKDLVTIAAKHLNGDEHVVGNFTSGGTESCMLSVKTAIHHAKETKGIDRPQVVMPDTLHAAFSKACHYFGAEEIRVPVDPETFRADPAAIADAITERTVLVAASAPSYAHGVVDPIPEIGALCEERDILFHVDACIGGWLLPYFERLGADIIPFDFRVPGVTSISMDLHKYAYAPKGASTILYRNKDIRRHQLFACAGWAGYTLINSTIQSTKSGGPVAAAWATVHYVGDQGYLEIAEKTKDATEQIIAGINEIPELRVLGEPDMSLVAFTSDELDVYVIVDEMKKRGWYVQPQLKAASSPANIHLTVTATSIEIVDDLLTDLRDCCELARGVEHDEDFTNLLAMVGALDPADFTPEMYTNMLEMAGLGGGANLPDQMAEINAILDALPSELREKLLIEFLNDLYQQSE